MTLSGVVDTYCGEDIYSGLSIEPILDNFDPLM